MALHGARAVRQCNEEQFTAPPERMVCKLHTGNAKGRSEEHVVIDLNERARVHMHGDVRLEIVPGATHLFEEPGALERVAASARDWFTQHLPVAHASSARAR